MICVTGAGGTVGSEVVRQLKAAGAPFRAAYHSQGKARAASEAGIEAVIIDYARPETLRTAFGGCDKLFLLGPSADDQTRLEINAVEAAKSAGVKHIVKLSVWGADREDFDFARVHRPVEKAIEASGMAWTFLRPNSFQQNAVNYMGGTIRSQNAFYSSVGDARISHIDVRDIAAVAVKALTQPGHEGKAYTLSGPEPLSYDQVAAALSQALGRDIRHVSLSPDQLKGGMLAEGLPEGAAAALLDLDRYYREDRASGVTQDVRQVTGREPRPFSQTVRDLAPALGPA